MRYLLAFVVSALCFCSTSPTSPSKTDSVKQPFTVCVALFNDGNYQIFAIDTTGKATGAMLAKVVNNGPCQVVDVPDGTRLRASAYSNTGMRVESMDQFFVAHAGDYWNL